MVILWSVLLTRARNMQHVQTQMGHTSVHVMWATLLTLTTIYVQVMIHIISKNCFPSSFKKIPRTEKTENTPVFISIGLQVHDELLAL